MAKESFAHWMNARHYGKCGECREEIVEGDRIVYEGDSAGGRRTYCATCGVDVAGEDPQESRWPRPA